MINKCNPIKAMDDKYSVPQANKKIKKTVKIFAPEGLHRRMELFIIDIL